MEKFCSPFASPRPWIILPHSFLDIVHRYRYHLHRFHRGWDRLSRRITSPYKFIFHPTFQVFFSHIWPRDHDSLSLERTFSSTRFVSIFEFGSSWSLEEGRKLKTRECSNDLVSPRERGGKKMKWKRRRKAESGIRNSLEIPPQL